MTERIVSGQLENEENRVEMQIRPTSLSEYVGQDQIKENLLVYIAAAKKRGEALDHTIFYGPPGLGKTTLANIIAREMGANLKATSGPAIEKPGDLAAILSNLSEGEVLFIDEIHRLHPTVEEVLYPAMEDFQLDIIIGQGPSARTLKLSVPKFTLIGATTRAGLLTSPLRDRFGVISRLEFYPPEDLCKIVLRSAGILNLQIEESAAFEIARRSRGTPRIANRILRRVRDFAEVKSNGTIDLSTAKDALSRMDIDNAGLDTMDRKMLLLMIEKFGGGPVGAETLSSALGEEKETLEEVFEPYLLQSGYLDKTARGRVATEQCFQHFGKKRSEGAPRLF
ncbi:MAG: Holliday junction branch migration DNA helicase RuvB [Nitrospirota bacterium]